MLTDAFLKFGGNPGPLALSSLSVGNNMPPSVVYDQSASGDAYDPLYILIQIGTAAASSGGGTLAINLLTDTVATLNSGNLITFPLVTAKAVAALTGNTPIYQGQLPKGLLEFFGYQLVVGTAVYQSGTLYIDHVYDLQTNRNKLGKGN